MIKTKIFRYLLLIILIQSCVFDFGQTEENKPNIEFGINVDNYKIFSDTIRPGDSFGEILIKKKLSYRQIY